MKIIERGCLPLKWEEENKDGSFEIKSKWMHFSRIALTQIEKISGKPIGEFNNKFSGDMTAEEQFDLLATLCHAGLNAYDLEEGNDIDYNKYKVANWVYGAAEYDEDFSENLLYAFIQCLPIEKKHKGELKEIIKGALDPQA